MHSGSTSTRQTLQAWLEDDRGDWHTRMLCMLEIGALVAECHREGRGIHMLDASKVVLVDGHPTELLEIIERVEASTGRGLALNKNDRGDATLNDSSLGSDPMLGLCTLSELTPLQRAYVSPELLVGLPSSQKSEQFSYCAMVYIALYGEPPLRYDNQTSHGIPVFTPVTFPRFGPVPRPLAVILHRGLSLQPSERWPSMTALLEQLQHQTERHNPVRQRVAQFSMLAVVLALAAIVAILFVT